MTELKVEGMHCEGCVARVNKALDALGIEHKVSIAEGKVELNCEEVKIPQAIEEIEDLGFTATRI